MRDTLKIRNILCLAVFVFFIAILGSSSWPEETYTFGVVPQYDQRQLFAIWGPVVDELRRRTGLSLKLATAPNISAFEKDSLQGRFDFTYMNPYHLLKANTSQGYLPLIRDNAPLRGILVVRKNSPIKNVSELSGKTIAFPSPNALGASLLMRADLSKLHHVSVVPLYVTSHDSVYLHVVKGLVEAGGGVQKTLEEQPKPVKDALNILYTTRALPSHPVAAHPRVPGAHAEMVRRAFLEMAASKDGSELLSKIPLKHPVSTSLDDYTPMREWGLEVFWVEE